MRKKECTLVQPVGAWSMPACKDAGVRRGGAWSASPPGRPACLVLAVCFAAPVAALLGPHRAVRAFRLHVPPAQGFTAGGRGGEPHAEEAQVSATHSCRCMRTAHPCWATCMPHACEQGRLLHTWHVACSRWHVCVRGRRVVAGMRPILGLLLETTKPDGLGVGEPQGARANKQSLPFLARLCMHTPSVPATGRCPTAYSTQEAHGAQGRAGARQAHDGPGPRPPHRSRARLDGSAAATPAAAAARHPHRFLKVPHIRMA